MLFNRIIHLFDILCDFILYMWVNDLFSLILEELNQRHLGNNHGLRVIYLAEDISDALLFETVHVFGKLTIFEQLKLLIVCIDKLVSLVQFIAYFILIIIIVDFEVLDEFLIFGNRLVVLSLLIGELLDADFVVDDLFEHFVDHDEVVLFHQLHQGLLLVVLLRLTSEKRSRSLATLLNKIEALIQFIRIIIRAI